jgi:hypothetical protein
MKANGVSKQLKQRVILKALKSQKTYKNACYKMRPKKLKAPRFAGISELSRANVHAFSVGL